MWKGKSCAIWRLKGELHVPQLLLVSTGNGLQAVADLEVHLSIVWKVGLPAGQHLEEAAGEADANRTAIAEG